MRYAIAPVKNLVRLQHASAHLMERAIGMPGIGLVWGETGAGKTTAATWLFNRVHGVYVRALSLWTPSAMLKAIARELDVEAKGSCAEMVETIVQALAQTGRPLFVDEADYVIERKVLVETLRDIHDLSTVPLILIGMGEITAKLKQRPQLAGRIAEEVEFKACDLADARLLAERMLDAVELDDDLVETLHAAARGSIRNIVVGLGRIEHEAQRRGLARIGLAEWPAGKGFFTGQEVQTPSAASSETPRSKQPARKGLAVVEGTR